jgi:two-component system LytT family response regulator
MLLKALIIDDESKSRKSLLQKLTDYCPEIEVAAEAQNGEEGIIAIGKHRPDLIFLDIEMPKMNGLQMLEQLNDFAGAIILTTAYNEYAIRAFKFSAFDYLLKPIDIQELKSTVSRLKKSKEAGSTKTPGEVQQNQLNLLIEHLKGGPELPKKIAIHTQEALYFFDLDEITRFEANSNYTFIYFANGTKMLASKTLKEFEELLPQKQFFRVHHSSIINLKFVRKYLKSDGGTIEMADGTHVDISRRKKDDFLQVIKHW